MSEVDSNEKQTEEESAEYKKQLIQQVLELQNTLDDLAQRVDSVKEQNSKLKSENQVLTQYIENLMSSSTIFQNNNFSKILKTCSFEEEYLGSTYNKNRNNVNNGITTANIFNRLSKLRIQGAEMPLSNPSPQTSRAAPTEGPNRPGRAHTAPGDVRRSRPQSLMLPSVDPSGTEHNSGRPPRPRSLIITPRRNTTGGEHGRSEVPRPRGRLPLRGLDVPTNGAATNNPDPFDLGSFRNELHVNGVKHEVSGCDFELVKPLGSGASGEVSLMRHKSSKVEMAVKKMRRTQDIKEQKRIFTDLNIVIKAHTCDHIIKSYGAFITETDVCICMEPMDTCLEKLLQRATERGLRGVPEEVLGKITVGVVTGLDYLKREYKVIHRDVKPSNILIRANGDVKVCDFGIAGNLVDSKAKTRDQGCPAYMSPERIDPPPDNLTYDIRADVWSLGVTLVQLSTGKYPYGSMDNQFHLMTEILQQDAPRLDPKDGFSPEFAEFVALCLVKDVEHRPKYERLLQHPFIRRYQEADKSVIEDWYREHFS